MLPCITSRFGIAVAALAGLTSAASAADLSKCINVVGSEAVSEKQSMDPAFSLGTDEAMNAWIVYEGLIRLSDQLQLIPQLATSWEPNADGTQWTFHLREGVKFHDGSDFDAADVVYTYRRLIDPATASPAAAELAFLSPDSIEAVDAHTVRFTTKAPVAELPHAISTKFAGIVPEGAKTDWLAANGNGTGAFKVEQFTRGGAVRVFVRNPDYWDKSLPKADCLRVTAIDQPVTLTTALLAGEADFAPYINATTAQTLKDNPAVTVHHSKAGTIYTLSMQVDKKPFDDVRVRQAMKLVIDRSALVQAAVLGYGEPANDNPVPPSMPGAFTSQVPQPDIAKAKQLLADAGHGNGLDIDIYTADVLPGLQQMAEAYAQMAAPAGINLRVNKVPADSFWTDVWMKQSFVTDAWSLRPFGNAFSLVYRSDAAWNETNWKRPDFDAKLDEARVTVDEAKRAELYNQLQKMLTEEGGVIAPVFAYTLAAMRSNCSGFVATPGTMPDFRQVSCAK